MPGPVVEGTHSALLYRDADELLAVAVPFLLDGLVEGAAVGAALPGRNLELLRVRLGAAADRVRLFDMTEVGRNPGRILAQVMHAVVGTRPDAPARIVDEPVWSGRSAGEYAACVQHEALVNLAFRGRPVSVLCPYDAARLPAAVLADAAATHPCLVEDGTARPSPAYAPAVAVDRTSGSLPEPAAATVFAFDGPRLAAVRRFAGEQAAAAGLDDDRVFDLVLAVGELAANSVRHGDGRGTVRMWTETARRHPVQDPAPQDPAPRDPAPEDPAPQDPTLQDPAAQDPAPRDPAPQDDRTGDGVPLLVAEVADAGWLSDPLAGRRPVAECRPGGRGLLLVHRLADLVHTATGPAGTTTRTYWRR